MRKAAIIATVFVCFHFGALLAETLQAASW